ncbi:hypothetical protein QTP88_019803 [Uroleucon formosanum]
MKIVGLEYEDPYLVYAKKYICSLHFTSNCSSTGTKRLNANALPSMFLPIQYNRDKLIDLDTSAMSGVIELDTSQADSNAIMVADKKFTVEQHISRKKHVNGVELKKIQQEQSTSKIQRLITEPSKKSSFNHDLCHALLSANIPMQKLQNEEFKNFLEKYTNKIIPDESTLRKGYVFQCYIDTIEKIRSYVENKKIWVTLDETTDIEGRYVANVVVGTLELNGPGKHFLINTEVLEKVNHSTILKLFDRSLQIIWPNGIKHDQVLLLLSNAVPYMVKADKNDATSIEKVIDLIADPDLELNLVFIKSYFGSLPNSITRLESSNICLADSIGIVEEQKNKIQLAKNIVGREIQHKFKTVLEKNSGYKTMQIISKILEGQEVTKEGLPDDLNADDITFFKHAPITSVEVERSFSTYKTLLSDNRRSFLFENIKHTLIVQCNKCHQVPGPSDELIDLDSSKMSGIINAPLVDQNLMNIIFMGEEDEDELDSYPSLMILSGVITSCTNAGSSMFWLISQLVPFD